MLHELIYFLGVAAASFTAVWTIWKTCRRILSAVHHWYHRLDDITKQLAPNGGTSLVDRVAAIEPYLLEIRRAELVHVHRWRTVTNLLGLAYWESDAAGHCIYVSTELARLMMGSPDEFLGTGWLAAVHPDDRERVNREWTAAVRDHGRFALRYRFWSRGRREKVNHVGASAEPIFDNDSSVHQWIGIVNHQSEPTDKITGALSL